MIPAPVVEHIDGVYVVRDDLIPGGTKRSFADQLIPPGSEVVYTSPAYGGAQIAIAHAAAERGAKATIFCAKRSQPHPRIWKPIAPAPRLFRFPTATSATSRPKLALTVKKPAPSCFPLA